MREGREFYLSAFCQEKQWVAGENKSISEAGQWGGRHSGDDTDQEVAKVSLHKPRGTKQKRKSNAVARGPTS